MTSAESGVPSPDVVWTQDNLLRGEVTGSNQYLSHPPDLDKQRQIMYSFIHADPSVLEKNTVVPITEPESDGFFESVRRGEIHPLEQEANWNQWEALGHVPAPASADVRSTLRSSDHTTRDFLSSALGTPFVDAAVMNIVASNPGPEMLNSELMKFCLAGKTKEAIAFRVKKADEVMHALYGDRQAYYEQLRKLLDSAFGKEEAGAPSEKAPSGDPKIKKLTDENQRLKDEAAALRIEMDEARKKNNTLAEDITDLGKKAKTLTEDKAELARVNGLLRKRVVELSASAGPRPMDVRKDPLGYYAKLGLDPAIAGLPEESIRVLIKGARRAAALAHHPDRGRDDAMRMQGANAAADFLGDPLKRRDYGR